MYLIECTLQIIAPEGMLIYGEHRQVQIVARIELILIGNHFRLKSLLFVMAWSSMISCADLRVRECDALSH